MSLKCLQPPNRPPVPLMYINRPGYFSDLVPALLGKERVTLLKRITSFGIPFATRRTELHSLVMTTQSRRQNEHAMVERVCEKVGKMRGLPSKGHWPMKYTSPRTGQWDVHVRESQARGEWEMQSEFSRQEQSCHV